MSGAPPPFKNKQELQNESVRNSNNNVKPSLVVAPSQLVEDFNSKYPSTKNPFELLDEIVDMVVGENVILKGDLNIENLIRIDGLLEGHITAPRQAGIIIGEKGSVLGNIFNFTACYINGKVVGDIIADSIVLGPNAVVHGNVKCMSLETAPTVTIVGDININPMESPCTIEDTPVEVSNNTTKQINDTIDNDDNQQKEIANGTPTSEVTPLANTSPTKESRDSIIAKKENSSPTKEGRDSMIGKKEKKPKNSTLLIIDPQVDFHFGGTCAIQGADQDSEKIAELIKENICLLYTSDAADE